MWSKFGNGTGIIATVIDGITATIIITGIAAIIAIGITATTGTIDTDVATDGVTGAQRVGVGAVRASIVACGAIGASWQPGASISLQEESGRRPLSSSAEYPSAAPIPIGHRTTTRRSNLSINTDEPSGMTPISRRT